MEHAPEPQEQPEEPMDPQVMEAVDELRRWIQEYAQRRAQFCGSPSEAAQAQRVVDSHIRVLIRACGYKGRIGRFRQLTWYD